MYFVTMCPYLKKTGNKEREREIKLSPQIMQKRK